MGDKIGSGGYVGIRVYIKVQLLMSQASQGIVYRATEQNSSRIVALKKSLTARGSSA